MALLDTLADAMELKEMSLSDPVIIIGETQTVTDSAPRRQGRNFRKSFFEGGEQYYKSQNAYSPNILIQEEDKVCLYSIYPPPQTRTLLVNSFFIHTLHISELLQDLLSHIIPN